MNVIQKIRALPLNRHRFIDVMAGVIVFQAIYVTLIILFCNDPGDPVESEATSLGKLIFLALVISPYFENLLLIGLAAIHEKLFNRTGLFFLPPLLLTALHFTTPKQLPFHVVIRVLTLFAYFYIYLKQYDLHKLEMGKHKALLLSSSIHFATNASGLLVAALFDPDIAAETIFSAQTGE